MTRYFYGIHQRFAINHVNESPQPIPPYIKPTRKAAFVGEHAKPRRQFRVNPALCIEAKVPHSLPNVLVWISHGMFILVYRRSPEHSFYRVKLSSTSYKLISFQHLLETQIEITCVLTHLWLLILFSDDASAIVDVVLI